MNYFYNLHLRPNLGLYQEDDWVAQHQGFQWGWRQGIAAWIWNKPVAQPFGPLRETVLSLTDNQPVALLDLDTGTKATRAELHSARPVNYDRPLLLAQTDAG